MKQLLGLVSINSETEAYWSCQKMLALIKASRDMKIEDTLPRHFDCLSN